MTDAAVTYGFSPFASVAAAYRWQVQGLLAALEPAVNPDKSLNGTAARLAAEYYGVLPTPGPATVTLLATSTLTAEQAATKTAQALQQLLTLEPLPGGPGTGA